MDKLQLLKKEPQRLPGLRALQKNEKKLCRMWPAEGELGDSRRLLLFFFSNSMVTIPKDFVLNYGLGFSFGMLLGCFERRCAAAHVQSNASEIQSVRLSHLR